MHHLLTTFLSPQQALKSQYTRQVLAKSYNEALKTAIKLSKYNKHYLLFSYILINDPQKISEFFRENKLNHTTLLYLIQQDICVQDIIMYLNTIKIRDYLFFLCIKELFINDKIEFDVEILLDNLDDYMVYKYCLRNNIELRKRNTVNYMYYQIHRGEYENLEYLLTKVKVYKDIEYLVELTNIEGHSEIIIDKIIKYIKGGFNKEICCTLLGSINNNLSVNFDTLKLILAHLISTKDTNYLVLALFLSRMYKRQFVNNYEIDLIYLFLLKYFLFFSEVLAMYKEMDIKNNQELNMSYIWTDVYINLRHIRNKDKKQMFVNGLGSFKKDKYFDYLKELKRCLLSSIPSFIEGGKISYALDIFKLVDKISNNIIEKELSEEKFIGKEKDTEFSLLLGKRCKYLFDKNVEVYDLEIDESVFDNDIYKIEDDEFRKWFIINKC